MRWFYVSCPRFTVAVAVDSQGLIRTGPPIVRKFAGQSLQRLVQWCRADRVKEMA